MNPGDMNRRVQLQYYVDPSQQPRRSLGARQSSPFTNGPKVWAKVRQSGSREFWQAQKNNSEVSLDVVIRYRSEVNAKSRLEYKGVTYEIVGEPIDIEDRREFLRLICKVVS